MWCGIGDYVSSKSRSYVGVSKTRYQSADNRVWNDDKGQ